MNVAFGTRVAAVTLTALVAAACSSGNSGQVARTAGHAPAPAPASAASAQQSRPQARPGAVRPAAIASPVAQCGNHLRMGLIMSDPAQPVRAQVAAFTRAAAPKALAWEVAAFREVATRFSAVVAGHGKPEALRRPAFGYTALLRLCRQSASG